MEIKEIINYIEDKKVNFNDKWYFHAMPFSKEKYKSVFEDGILAPYLLEKANSTYQYIFVSRANNNKYSAFTNYSIYPNFIISDKVHTIKYNDGVIKKIICGGFHDIKFTSLYKDEYQVYKKIKPQDIIGIIFNIEKLTTDNKKEAIYYLKVLQEIIILLDELKVSIPIIDYYTEKEINKQKLLSISKNFN